MQFILNKILKKQERQIKQSISENIKLEDFELTFLQQENNSKNIIYSPLSIKYILKMLSDGAEGSTKVQIDNIIKNQKYIKYSTIPDILSFVNSIYINKKYSDQINNNYNTLLNEKYNAEIKFDELDSADNINKWVEDKTFGIIRKILEDREISADTSLIVINALAINMAWQDKFRTFHTHGDEFYLEDGTVMIATMMNKTLHYENSSYYHDNNVIAVSLNLEEYNNTQLEFIVIMPQTGYKEFIKKFTMDNLKTITAKLQAPISKEYDVELTIPKFSYDYELQLTNDLQRIGMHDAFDKEKANFSKMISPEAIYPIYINKIKHKANIEFSEEGIKAAAVTAAVTLFSGVPFEERKIIELKLNKPFIYFIRDKKNEEIWFVGTVDKPNSWDEDRKKYRNR